MPNAKGDNISSTLGDPCLFPHALDEPSKEVVFVPTNREKLSKASFLDGREPFTILSGEKRHPLKDLIAFYENEPGQINPWNFIFHTGFCCSTLLARCLDQQGTCLSLKEPKILNSLSHCKKFSRSKNQTVLHHKKLELVLNLLSRRFSEKEKIIIKPSNVDVVLLDEILSLNPNSKIIFIFSNLKNFLISVAKGGQPRRDFVRRLLSHLLVDFKTRGDDLSEFIKIPENLIWNLNDLQLAALVWHLQMRYLCASGGKNNYWLNCEDFLAEPEKTLEKLKNFLGFWNDHPIRDFGKLKTTLSRHAKAPSFSYNTTKRQTDFIAIENYLSPVLPEIIDWAEEVCLGWEKNKWEKIAV